MPKKSKDEFTLEKLKVVDKLDRIEKHMITHTQRFEHHCEKDELMQTQVTKMVEQHDKMLLGSNGHPGIKMEVDRLKQDHKSSQRWQNIMHGALWAAVAGLVAKAVWTFMQMTTV
jgi:hypothetical protein